MDSMNLYGYGWGSPIGASDPMGLWFEGAATGMVTSDNGLVQMTGYVVGTVGAYAEQATRGTGKAVQGAAKMAKETGLIIVDGVGAVYELTTGNRYDDMSEWGKVAGDARSDEEAAELTQIYCADALANMATCGAEELARAVKEYIETGDADRLAERAGALAAANVVASKAVQNARARSQGKTGGDKCPDGPGGKKAAQEGTAASPEPRAGPTSGRGGRGPVDKGKAGVDMMVAEIEAKGGTVLGREVTIKTRVGGGRVDVVYRTASGEIRIGEAKHGPNAKLSAKQQRTYPVIEREGGVWRRQRAIDAGFMHGRPTTPIPVDIFRYGGAP
jgi:hypothetical protein